MTWPAALVSSVAIVALTACALRGVLSVELGAAIVGLAASHVASSYTIARRQP